MPTLTAPAISARETERRAQEILLEFLQSYFTGNPHQAPIGEVTFENCEILFNQTQIDDPTADRSQIHLVFSDFAPKETWFANGNLSPWERGVLAAPASGVAYGLTVRGTIEEAVHGKLVRTLPGTNIRWMVSGSDLLEQTLIGSTWETHRTFAGAHTIGWKREGADYVEQVQVGTTWNEIRAIAPVNPLWDGTRKLVTAPATINFYLRSVNAGDEGEAAEFRNRRLASHLVELLQRDEAHVLLAPKGLRRFRIQRGPTPLSTTGYQTRLLVAATTFRYFLPRQH